jgi:mannosyl-oligosaccharide alpha-1,2-mannosidase
VVNYEKGKVVDKMDHLTCFLPGMLALGASGITHDRDLLIAKELIATCFDMYACVRTGLAPEVRFKYLYIL